MFTIDNKIVEQLEKFEIQFPEANAKAKNDVNSFTLYAGMRFPVVQVSKTVLQTGDIRAFNLYMGINSKVPYMNITFRDSYNEFKESDYINEETSIRVWLGSMQSDELPINLAMVPTDVQSKNGNIVLTALLDLHREPITIAHGTVQEMLESLAEQTGLGIRCNYDDLLSKDYALNHVNVDVKDFLKSFCHAIGIDQWFIDSQYNLCLYDVQKLIDEHQPKTCDVLFYNNEKLEEPQEVKYTNDRLAITQFSFASFGYDFIKGSKKKIEVEAVEFDKSYVPTLETYQTIENDFVDQPDKPDMDTIYFDEHFNPYIVVGATAQLDINTSVGYPKRITVQEFEDGERKQLDQLPITDISGVYALMDARYSMSAGRLNAMISWQRPTPEQQQTTEEQAPTLQEREDKLQAENQQMMIAAPTFDYSNEEPEQGQSKNKIVRAMQFFISKGLSEDQAAGIVGNLLGESNLNTNLDLMDSNGLRSYGIAMWNGPRRAKILAIPGHSDLDTQLSFCWSELTSDASLGLSKVRSSSSVSDAVYQFLYNFERPKDRVYNGANHKRRTRLANRALNTYRANA